jgi:hypothetical protein
VGGTVSVTTYVPASSPQIASCGVENVTVTKLPLDGSVIANVATSGAPAVLVLATEMQYVVGAFGSTKKQLYFGWTAALGAVTAVVKQSLGT